jgi:cell cycle checkpoint protein
LELGAILKLKQQQQQRQQVQKDKEPFIPLSHLLFSKLTFTREDRVGMQVDEDGVDDEEEQQQFIAFNGDEAKSGPVKEFGDGDDLDNVAGSWLKDDDIEDF